MKRNVSAEQNKKYVSDKNNITCARTVNIPTVAADDIRLGFIRFFETGFRLSVITDLFVCIMSACEKH